MGWQLVTQALQTSEARGSARLVLLALAWHCDDTTGRGWPSVACLARETKLHARNVQHALRTLVTRDEVTVSTRAGHASVYTIPVQGVAEAPRVADPPGVAEAPWGGGATAVGGVAEAPPRTVREQSRTVRRRRAPRRPWPEDFTLTSDRRRLATEAGCEDPALCFAEFRAWAKRDGATYADWAGAWEQQCLAHRGKHAGRKACRHGDAPRPVGMDAIRALMRERPVLKVVSADDAG